MQVTIKGIDIEFNYSVKTFSDIVQYKKFYEPLGKVTLTEYLSKVDDENYSIDLLCDLIYYPHAIRCRNVGKAPILSYSDIFEWVMTNLDQVGHVVNSMVDSLPKVEEKEEVKKKVVRKSKN
jgi:hypothetical protein